MKAAIILVIACMVATVTLSRAQEQTNTEKYVSKEDYLKLKEDHDKLKQELEVLRGQMQQLLSKPAGPSPEAIQSQVQDLQKKQAAQQAETDSAVEELDKGIKGKPHQEPARDRVEHQPLLEELPHAYPH